MIGKQTIDGSRQKAANKALHQTAIPLRSIAAGEIWGQTKIGLNLFYSKVKALKRLPFESKTPNKETIHAFKDSDEGKNLVKTRNLDDLFNQLGL